MQDIFQQSAEREFAQAGRELPSSKQCLSALNKSYQRYDHLIARSIEQSATKPACQAGCAFCCHYKVEVRAHEMLAIKDYISQHFSQVQVEQLLAEAQQNAQQIRTLSPEQHLTTNIKCPLLRDNQCSIYPVRPYRCRNFHATDADACASSFADPGDMHIATGMIETIALIADGHTQGFEAAVAQKGLDPGVYDFTTALLEVFADDACSKRFARGKKTFQQAIEVL